MAAERNARASFARRLSIAVLAAWAATNLQGCLPPDWSFCDCDYRDNFWNHVLNDIHMLWDVADEQEFIRKARDNTTFQGKYLQNPPQGLDCPWVADRFWKAWPQYGMTRGLIEGSKGDLWMPAARDRFKSTCIAGHFALVAICSQHFLVKAARGIEDGQPDYMRYMEAAYGHMVSLRNLAAAHEIRNCLRQEGWSLDGWALLKYSERWIGKESDGTAPVAAYAGTRMDPFQMLFTKNMAHTEKSRKEALPHRQPCVPYKNPQCWKRMSKLLMDTCEHCCSPFIHKTGRGDPMCFDSVWTYERCCQTDFKDLVCKVVRKGEEGGCVDCKKTVYYECLTPPEKRLQDAQSNYNDAVDKFHSLRAHADKVAQQIGEAKIDLFQKDEVYREKHGYFNEALHIWSAAYNNRTRLNSEARLLQQNVTWNSTANAMKVAKANLVHARDVLKNKTETLKKARDAESLGRAFLERNESAHAKAIENAGASRTRLSEARQAQSNAEAKCAETDRSVLLAQSKEEECQEHVRVADQQRLRVFEATADALDSSMLALRSAEAAEHGAAEANRQATAARDQSGAASRDAEAAVQVADKNITRCLEEEAAATRSLGKANDTLDAAIATLAKEKASLDDMVGKELSVHDSFMNITGYTASVRCLLARTPGNASARPENVSAERELIEQGTCQQPDVADKNEFCKSWAAAGECDRNAAYMLKNCPVSCGRPTENLPAMSPAHGGKGGASRKMPMCTALSMEQPQRLAFPTFVPALMLELADAVDVGPTANADFAAALEAAETEVIAARAALRIAVDNREAAAALVTSRQNVLTKAEEVLAAAQSNESSVRAERDKVAALHADAEEDLRGWQAWQARNESAVKGASDFREEKQAALRKAELEMEQAVVVEEDQDKARREADEATAQKADAVTRIQSMIVRLEEQVHTLNASLNENLTSIVTQWLQAKEAAELPAEDNSWSSKLISAAARAFVSVVSSIETFLNSYVVNMKDKDHILQLVHSIDHLKASRTSLKAAEVNHSNAIAYAADALDAAKKAEAARQAAEERASQAARSEKDAAQRLLEAQAVLNGTLQEVNASSLRLAEANRTLLVHDAWLRTAESVTAAAEAVVTERRLDLAGARTGLEGARAGVVEAKAALAEAERHHTNLEADAALGYFRRLQEECGASDAELQAYREERELLTLIRAGVLHREAVTAMSSDWHFQAVANRSAAEALLEAASEAVAVARRLHAQRVEEAAAADAVLELRTRELNATATKWAEARGVLTASQDSVAGLLGQRQGADADVSEKERLLSAASHSMRQASQGRAERQRELAKAINLTLTRDAQADQADAEELKAEKMMKKTRAWLPGFVEQLELDRKEGEVQAATQEEARRSKMESKASAKELRFRKLRDTHVRHLALLNKQVELDLKERERVRTKSEFTISEQAVLTAKDKLDKLVEDETKTQENIVKTHTEVGRLLEEHGKAQKGYNEQDPEDRKRSFRTLLESSGPDPNGVDLR